MQLQASEDRMIPPPRWRMMQGATECARCERPITAGAWVRLMTKSDLKYCVACAVVSTGEEPPRTAQGTVYEAKPAGPSWRAKMAKFNKAGVAAELRGKILDYRAKRAGSDE
jgi:hypothetical protein